MKGKDLFQAMGEISDRYIEEAAPDEKTLERMASSKQEEQILSMERTKNGNNGTGTKASKTKGSKRKWYQNPRILGGLTMAAAVLLLVGIGIHASGIFTGGLGFKKINSQTTSPGKQNNAGAEYMDSFDGKNGSSLAGEQMTQKGGVYFSGETKSIKEELREEDPVEEEKSTTITTEKGPERATEVGSKEEYTEEVKGGNGFGDGFAYRKVDCSHGEGEVKRGFEVYDSEDKNYPFKMAIWSGPRSTGGYDIEVTSVKYDGETLTVIVRETSPKPEDVVTEAFTYPGCGIEFSILPDSFVVKNEGGAEFELTYMFLEHAEIYDDWCAAFKGGAGESTYNTYVYETRDGRYRYLNVSSVTESWGSTRWKNRIVGNGIVDTKEEILEAAKVFGSDGFYLTPDDQNNPRQVSEFLKKNMKKE